MVTAGPRTRRRDEEERIILMKSRDRRAERMSEFVTNMFQYNVTVGITRSEVFVFSFFLIRLIVAEWFWFVFLICGRVGTWNSQLRSDPPPNNKKNKGGFYYCGPNIIKYKGMASKQSHQTFPCPLDFAKRRFHHRVSAWLLVSETLPRNTRWPR